MLKIAVAKGVMFDQALLLLANIGVTFDEALVKSRQLSYQDQSGSFSLLCVRSWDVPTYVQEGVADLGIVGRDVLLEQNRSVVSLLDLKFGPCQLVIAGPKEATLKTHCRVATKYVHATEKYFCEKGMKVNIVKLYGAMELAPLFGLSDFICDLTATGATLKANQLHILETVFSSTGFLIANQSSMACYYDDIIAFSDRLAAKL